VPETEKTDPLFFMEGILRNSSKGNIDETSQEDGEEGGKYVMAGDPDFGESQRNHINLNHDEKEKGNEEKKNHEENSEGVKKHRTPPYFRLSLAKSFNYDEFVRGQKMRFSVIPAKFVPAKAGSRNPVF
jgi:chromosomal replication initiation ATPase DnaA